jgi:biopolymer transport protein ExbD
MFEKPHRREPIEPQLAALIDVFSILIIFLIAGTVMGNTVIVLPGGLRPPTSISKEAMLVAPQLTIHENSVSLNFTTENFLLSSLLLDSSQDLVRFKSAITKYVTATKGKENTGVINLVADHSETYDRIFSVLKILREAGMHTILFVSMSKANHG